jgi:mono/diheme cytochrome c family protein
MTIRLCSTSAVCCVRAFLAVAVAICSGGIARAAAVVQAEAAGLAFFENRIRPVFVEHCYSCHSAEAKTVKGAFKLDTKEDFLKGGTDGVVVVAGQPEQSRLIRAVRQMDKDFQMPPKKSGGTKLPDAAIADLVEWVKMGAPYPETPPSRKAAAPRLWALEPVKDAPPPAVKNQAWPATSVDSFILAKIEERGLRPAAQADRRTLIRRATLDLTGLPPTPEEVDAFLADRSTNAFARVVERLLSSPRYGEHWGRHWLDVVRYADTAGDTADYPLPEAWRYRNYVIDSFNADKPYDEFLREQIAGDILAKQGSRDRYAERVVATGYLALSRRFGFDSENYHHLTIQDTIDTLGQSVLGLTMGCARCHDHKFDPLLAQDYYALYGIFASTRYSFPGSEQKGRYRAMVPLVPVEESQPKWREMQSSYASSGITPAAVLRSLDDLDGDFEMQRFAAGGSYGVLVPPWLYEGKVSVTQGAQSPFKHLHPFGTVGASVAPGAGAYVIRQTFRPNTTNGVVHVNLEFRVATNIAAATGRHRFRMGAHGGTPAVDVWLARDSITVPGGDTHLNFRLPKPGDWHCLQLILNLDARTYTGSVGVPGNRIDLGTLHLLAEWKGGINYVALDSSGTPEALLPGLEVDNIGVQTEAIPPVFTKPPSMAAATPSTADLNAELQALVGPDGDLEAQAKGKAPSAPFHPGPSSAVRIVETAQSPYTNLYPAGTRGIHLPATADGAYNGFGNNIAKPWKAQTTEKLHVGFDFRAANSDSPKPGTWRFHIGRSSSSAAVELGLGATELYCRSENARDRVATVQPGEWHQVQLVMNLKERTYNGTVATRTNRTAFAGSFAIGWEGTIDYFFIDSGGHIKAAKPALDVDNFMVSDQPLPPIDGPATLYAAGPKSGTQARIKKLREQLEKRAAEIEAERRKLDAQLAAGPVALAYAVSEGTPHDARLQLRGEPDRPGPEVPRGFIRVLGNSQLPQPPEGANGSGRLELAHWLTRADNPLTARVMVNRIWQYHFGRALVRTANDFGARSQPPTHPELLDHLASRFIQSGWSIKAMHRLLMLSATYQQGSGISETVISNQYPVAARSSTASLNTDSLNTDYFSSFTRRRLSAEEIRDSILSVSGALDAIPGKEHPFPPPHQWGYSQHGPFTAVYEHDKRSVYLMVQRIKRHPFLALFDGADPNSSTAERRITTVPTQALYFLNDPFVHAKSIKMAERLQATRPTERGQVELASLLALGRPATEAEQAEAAEFLAAGRSELKSAGVADPDRAALAAYVRTLFGSNEFLHCD